MKTMRATWMVFACCLVLVACGDDPKEDTSNGGGAGATAGTTGGTSGTAAGASGSTAGTAGTPSCPADPGTTMCAGAACPAVQAALVSACVQTCCTADSKCGTLNAAAGGACTTVAVNDTLCPDETILGTMTPGCCVPGTNQCGIIDIVTGSGSCVARAQVPAALATLAPANCDGTTPTATAGAGGAGAGGAGAGGAGSGG